MLSHSDCFDREEIFIRNLIIIKYNVYEFILLGNNLYPVKYFLTVLNLNIIITSIFCFNLKIKKIE